MANAMRDLMDILTGQQEQPDIDEAGAGPARIMSHIRRGELFIMLSAMRADLPRAQNMQRTAKLKSILSQLPVSYIQTEGEYQEEGQPEPSVEKSFFVMPRRGTQGVTPESFRAFGIKLMHSFNQDSILYGDGALVSLIFKDGSSLDLGDTMTFRDDVIPDLGGFSKVKGRKFSFTDQPTAGKSVGRATIAGQKYRIVA